MTLAFPRTSGLARFPWIKCHTGRLIEQGGERDSDSARAESTESRATHGEIKERENEAQKSEVCRKVQRIDD